MNPLTAEQDTHTTGELRAEAAPGTFAHDGAIPSLDGPTRPAYAWRGLMLDSVRTFWSVDDVCEVLDLMARYRLNRFHWHLTDDGGWRFEVPHHPLVVEVGARLPREPFVWYNNVDVAKREEVVAQAPKDSTTGWYSDADIARVVGHAEELGIQIMPEVDLPGHMAAVIRAYPTLGDPALADMDPKDWTHRNDLLWPGPAADAFLRDALEKVCDLFPTSVVHIGGDECDYRVWEADAELMQRMADQGISSAKEIQGLFTDLARRTLSARGREVAAWDEVTETPCRGDELIFGWREKVGVPAARDSGHPWIYCDADVLYFNRLSGPVATEPAGMFGAISITDVLDIELPENDLLCGVQAHAWCEFIPDTKTLYYHLFPRLLAVAELAWNGRGPSDREAFAALVETEMSWLAAHGVVGRALDRHSWASSPSE